MSNNQENDGYGISVFKSGTPSGAKTRGIIFFIIFCLIILIQAFYWLFANSVKPLVLGMPFGMFFIVLFIAIEFIALLVVYFTEAKDVVEGGGS